MPTCATCASDNSDSAKFCSECGASLSAAPAGAGEERKVVSVVFVDLVGSTARAETSDPEDVRAPLRVYHERAQDELERHGGTVEKFIGDAVVAVFGAPVSHEDDHERAVRGALAVARRLGRDEESRDALDEVVSAMTKSETVGAVQDEHVTLVFELQAHGLTALAEDIVRRMTPSAWIEVCKSVLAGDFVAAADWLESMGEQPHQADLRLTAARALAAEGRLKDAEEQLKHARAFWRSVGATAYLRAADEVIAAAS